MEALEESDSLLSLGEGLGGRGDDERDFLDLLDTVATGKDEGGEGRSSQGRDNGEPALVLVDLDVPFAPSLGRREHTTTTAHVTKGSLVNGEEIFAIENRLSAPVPNGGYHHHQHGEYELRHDQYPTTRHSFGDQLFQRRSRPGACS